MRQTRILLACLAGVMLAACGTDTPTSPATESLRREDTTAGCDGTLVPVLGEDGIVTYQCVGKGLWGSGSGG